MSEFSISISDYLIVLPSVLLTFVLIDGMHADYDNDNLSLAINHLLNHSNCMLLRNLILISFCFEDQQKIIGKWYIIRMSSDRWLFLSFIFEFWLSDSMSKVSSTDTCMAFAIGETVLLGIYLVRCTSLPSGLEHTNHFQRSVVELLTWKAFEIELKLLMSR